MSATPQTPVPQVFISYARADDQSFDDETPGWVTHFIDHLEKAVRMQMGGVHFWMDHELEPYENIEFGLRQRILKSSCFVACLSPGYLRSDWCKLELTTFAGKLNGEIPSNRLLLVELLPTERSERPPESTGLTPVQFWTNSKSRPEAHILGWPVPDPRKHEKYWEELNQLGARIARQIKNLPPEPDPVAIKAPADHALSVPASSKSEGPLRLIINADKPDSELGEKAKAILKDKSEMGVEIEAFVTAQPAPDQTPAKYRQDVSEQLECSHGVLIVYGEAPPSWVQSQYALASKVLAMRKQAIWGGLLDGPPQEKPDHGLPSRRLQLLNCRDGLDPKELKGFVDTLRGNGHV